MRLLIQLDNTEICYNAGTIIDIQVMLEVWVRDQYKIIENIVIPWHSVRRIRVEEY